MVFGLAVNLHPEIPQTLRFTVLSAILAGTLLVMLLLGFPLAVAAYQEAKRKRLSIEALFLLTLFGALAASLQAHLSGRGDVYYEVVSILLVVYTFGKVVASHGREAALASLSQFANSTATCRRLQPCGVETVPLDQIRPGDLVEVNPGERIPVDGVIRHGHGLISETVVTGEPYPSLRTTGDRVIAGSESYDAAFQIEATTAGNARQQDAWSRAVEAGYERQFLSLNRIDMLSRLFTPTVALVALSTFLYWHYVAAVGTHDALFYAMSVLLVACPCVIGLATPVVAWSLLGRLASLGLVTRDTSAIERIAEADTVVFDKTGTLTETEFDLVEIETLDRNCDTKQLHKLLLAVQSRSSHPVAKAFTRSLDDIPANEWPSVERLVTVPGCGVEADLVWPNGRQTHARIGTPDWIGSSDASPRNVNDVTLKEIAIEHDGTVVARATVRERLRDTAAEAIEQLTTLGVPVEILSGDTGPLSVTLPTADCRTGVLPLQKRDRVLELVRQGRRPLVLGDGINDAPALAHAHVGVAMASGTDIAVSASRVTLYGGDITAIPSAIAVCRRAKRLIDWSIWRAVIYNVIGMSIAACGLLHPIMAALLMVASSLTLVIASARAADPSFCHQPVRPSSTKRKFVWPTQAIRAIGHAVAIAAQGYLLIRLAGGNFDSSAVIALSFTVLGAGTALLWYFSKTVSHSVDMLFGMFSLGGFGMLLGWRADHQFQPMICAQCYHCSNLTESFWMWTGMYLFGNFAMLFMGKSPIPQGWHKLAMFTGGNIGMAAGMIAGGAASQLIIIESLQLGILIHFVGMMIGMNVGMLFGSWAAENLLISAAAWASRNTVRRFGSTGEVVNR